MKTLNSMYPQKLSLKCLLKLDLFILLVFFFAFPAASSASVRINEIMASNSSGLTDSNGEQGDWIELFNDGVEAVDIGGYYLSDDPDNLQKWQFPSPLKIYARGYRLVFADDSDSPPSVDGELHANFNLNKSGEYLALVARDGVSILHEFSPSYPQQSTDISYGYSQRAGMPSEKLYYFESPTPGRINMTSPLEGKVSDVIFSKPHGYYEEPFTLELIAEEGTQIRYTLDGSAPTQYLGTIYTEPLEIKSTTVLRTIAYKTGFVSSEVGAASWIFLDDVLKQSTTPPEGWPASFGINNQRMYYGMNPSIVRSSLYTKRLSLAFRDIQTISLSTDLKNLFNPQTGIYVNPSGSGMDWERPVSVELIDPAGGAGFQINAGLRIRGGFSRTADNPKHSLKLYFRGQYGQSTLKYPLFESEGTDEFAKIDLRTAQNYSWACNGAENCTFVREVFSRDLQGEVETPYTRSRHYHLFINGIYWGLYQTQERVDAHYAQSYLSGEKEDWDCIHTGSAVDGNMNAYSQFYNITAQGYSGDYQSNYNRVKGLNPDGTRNPDYPMLLDETNLIKLMLNVYYTADWDSPFSLFGNGPNNLFAIYNRVNPDGFKWFRHDSEHTLGANTAVDYDLTAQGWNRTGLSQFEPMMLHQKLAENPEYRIHFADLVQEEFFDEGVLTPQKCADRFKRRMAEIDNAVVAESARWGAARGTLRTRETWVNACNYLLNTYFPQRTALVIKQFKKQGWYPELNPPVSTLASGLADEGEKFTLSAGSVFYYTTDGTDPRLEGGAINPKAFRVPDGTEESKPYIPRTFISKESNWKYYDQGSFPPILSTRTWRNADYDDSQWKEGKARLGFGTRVAVNTQTSNINSSGEAMITTYFRHEFNVDSLDQTGGLRLSMNRDDGALVYLNGVEIVRSNMPDGTISYSTLAAENIGSPNEDTFIDFDISSQKLLLGRNVICVEVHQSNAASSDLYFDLELCTCLASGPQPSSTVLEVDKNQKIFARSYYAGVWSAAQKYTYNLRQNYDSLRVSELMYSPMLHEGDTFERDDYAWLELCNTGTNPVNMQDVSFSEGISYTFPNIDIPAGGYLVLAKNADAFIERNYSDGIILLSGYNGNLARKGETLTLLTPEGQNIQSFNYSNNWYPLTDKKGYSLEIANMDNSANEWSQATVWRTSSLEGGSPGFGAAIVAAPAGQISMLGQSVQFTWEEAGERSPIQWFYWDSHLGYWSFVKETLSNQFVIEKVDAAHAGLYRAEYEADGIRVSCMPFELSVVLNEPEDKVIEESTSGNLLVQLATLSPQSIRWQKYNSAGVWEDILNGTGRLLQFSYSTMSDAGTYRVIFSNLWVSRPVTLEIAPESQPPSVMALRCIVPSTLEVSFSEYVSIESALNISNFQLDNGGKVLGVTADTQTLIPAGAIKLFLQIEALSPGFVYQLTVSGLEDISSQSNKIIPQSTYFQTELPYGVLRQVWYNCNADLTSLTSKPTYPNKTDFSEYIKEFTTPVNWSDNYGQRLSGYVIAPVAGLYTFWIASDDSSALYLSTDTDPSNKKRIAYVDGWTNDREWTKFTSQKSVAIRLNANTPYYIEAIQTEGNGGDNLAVRWQLPSGVIEEPLGGERLCAAGTGTSQITFSAPQIVVVPKSVSCNEGESATFEVWVQSSAPITYLWEVNGMIQNGQTGRVFTIERAALEQNGAQIKCRATNFKGTTESESALLWVNSAPKEAPLLKIVSGTSNQIYIEFEGRLQRSSSLVSPKWVEVAGESPLEITPSEEGQFYRAYR